MKKVLNVSQELKTFEGKPLRENDAFPDDAKIKDPRNPEKMIDNPVLILKKVLLGYMRVAHAMGLNEQEQTTAYEVGVKIGVSDGKVELSTAEYDLLKKVCDKNKITQQNGQEVSILPTEQGIQAKLMVDKAETIDKQDKKGE